MPAKTLRVTANATRAEDGRRKSPNPLPGRMWEWTVEVEPRGAVELPDEIFGEFLQDIHSADCGNVRQVLAACIQSAGKFEVVYRQYTPSRAIVWMQAQGRGIRDERTGTVRIIGFSVELPGHWKPSDTERLLKSFLDSNPSPAFIKDTQGRYLYANDQLRNLCNAAAGEVLGKTDRDLHPRAQAEVSSSHDLRVLEEGAPLEFEEGAGNHLVLKFPMRNASGQIFAIGGIVNDVAKRAAGGETGFPTSRLESLVANSPLAVAVAGRDGRVELCNAAFEKLFLYKTSDVIGVSLKDLIFAPEMQWEWDAILRRLHSGENVDLTTHRRRKDGAYVDVEVHAVPLLVGGELHGAYVVYNDIRERIGFEEALREREESLRQLSARLFQSQDEERRRISQELHDHFNQKLAILAMEADSLANEYPRMKRALLERVLDLAAHIHLLSEDVHRTAFGLHPSSIEHLGLAVALRSFCNDFAARHAVKLTFKDTGVPESVPPDVSLCLYRILQEALGNVSRHSKATTVQVSLTGSAGELHLTIDDDGIGFRRNAAMRRKGQGITGMEERARLIGGFVSLSSRMGGGTRIDVRIPAQPGMA